MMEYIMFILAWKLNLSGMYCLMFGVPEVSKCAVDRRKIIKVAALVIELFLIFIMKIEEISVLYLMFFQYFLWLYKNYKEEKECGVALRGAVGIVSVVVAELIIGDFFYIRCNNISFDAGIYSTQVLIASLTLSAMVQYMAILVIEVFKLKDHCSKFPMYMLVVKTVEELYFYGKIIVSFGINTDCTLERLGFIVLQMINYMILLIIIWEIKRCNKRDGESNLKVNKYEYYLHMEEEHLKIRRLYHDIKNQLMIVEDMRTKEPVKLKEYIQNISKELESMEQYYHTGQTVLDIILYDSNRRAKSKGIEFDVVISENCLNFLDEMDLGVIFTNAINNAIEECEKITSGPKKIQIKAGENLNDVLIYIKNSVNETRQKGSLTTKKKKNKMHGIGLSSIQKAVEKYQGYISIQEDKAFQLTILFVKGKEMNNEKKMENSVLCSCYDSD